MTTRKLDPDVQLSKAAFDGLRAAMKEIIAHEREHSEGYLILFEERVRKMECSLSSLESNVNRLERFLKSKVWKHIQHEAEKENP